MNRNDLENEAALEALRRHAGYKGSTTPGEHRDEWRTPHYLFRWAVSLLGGIDRDTACTRTNALAMPVWASNPVNGNPVRGNALSVKWTGRCWCNPPYSETSRWIDYAIEQDAITAMLVPSPNGESYYDRLIANSHEIHIVGRIAFIGADGKPKSGNSRGSSLFIIGGYGKGSRSFAHRDLLMQQFGGGV